MEETVILVVDMLKGFLEEGHPLYCGEKARKTIHEVARLLESRKDARVIFVCDNHEPDDREFEIFPPHCIKGSEEAQVVDELAGFDGINIPKTRYSALYRTPLEDILKDMRPDKVIVTGVCTDICVLHTVADLRMRDYEVEVPSRCVASFNEKAHRFALKHMEKVLGAKII